MNGEFVDFFIDGAVTKMPVYTLRGKYPLRRDFYMVFVIEAKTPCGKDGIGRMYYFDISNGEDAVEISGFSLNGIKDCQSGQRWSLAFLTESWNSLVNSGWFRVESPPEAFIQRHAINGGKADAENEPQAVS